MGPRWRLIRHIRHQIRENPNYANDSKLRIAVRNLESSGALFGLQPLDDERGGGETSPPPSPGMRGLSSTDRP